MRPYPARIVTRSGPQRDGQYVVLQPDSFDAKRVDPAKTTPRVRFFECRRTNEKATAARGRTHQLIHRSQHPHAPSGAPRPSIIGRYDVL